MKKLSEFDLNQCIYMSVGSHVGNEDISSIIKRKMKEVEDCGWSLWAYSTDRKLDMFCDEYRAKYVVMACTGRPVKSNGKKATKYYLNEEEMDIPNEICVTYAENRRFCHALMVEEYYLIDKSDNTFIKSEYGVPDGYVGIRDIWPMVKDMKKRNKREYPIVLVAKLKGAFSVKVK